MGIRGEWNTMYATNTIAHYKNEESPVLNDMSSLIKQSQTVKPEEHSFGWMGRADFGQNINSVSHMRQFFLAVLSCTLQTPIRKRLFVGAAETVWGL